MAAALPAATGAAPAALQPVAAEFDSASLAEVQRRHILAILRKTRGIMAGDDGAARLLNMKPGTVRYRMMKLGVDRHESN